MPVPHRTPVTLVIALAAAAVMLSAQSAPMTNASVVTLEKSGLGDQVVIARINQADRVDFKLEDSDLIALKDAGVSSVVIEAMLKRATTPARGGADSGPAPTSAAVTLLASAGETVLHPQVGDTSMTYAYVTVLRFMDYPGLHSQVRTNDRNPKLVVASAESPVGRFFVVKADPDTKHGVRSVKMGRGGMFGSSGLMTPDGDWQMGYTAEKSSATTWRLTLKKPLAPGEYGVFVRTMELYDFGVD
jgi:hypothetical protein